MWFFVMHKTVAWNWCMLVTWSMVNTNQVMITVNDWIFFLYTLRCD